MDKSIACPCALPDSGKRTYHCPRLGTKMTPGWCKLYLTKPGHRELYDNGHAPGQSQGLVDGRSTKRLKRSAKDSNCDKRKKPAGLGDRVEQALTAVGITSERVSTWLGQECGCAERREKLNRFGAWVSRVLSGKTEDAEEYLDRIIDDT